MAQLLEFVTHHWLLCSLFAGVLVMFIVNELRIRAQGTAALSPQQVIDMMNHEHGVVVDIREPEAFANGHILGSLNVPHQKLQDKKGKLNKYKSKPVIVVCPQGILAAKVSQRLKEDGFEQVYKLSGGIAAWQQEQLPLNKA